MDTVERARSFFESNGRAIDRALFAFHFDGGSSADVMAALKPYQNDDGGFGNGLEPDITAPDSNPFATALALQICLQAEIARNEPVLARTVEYLEATQDDDGGWRFTEGVYQHELAPWFAGWEWPNLNPACSLAGHLKALGLGCDRLHERVEQLFEAHAKPTDMVLDDFYAVQPYAFYFMPPWEHPQRELYLWGLSWWLVRQHVEGKLADSGHFFEYARDPRSPTAQRVPGDIVAQRLDMLAAEQAEDGGWPSAYADHWRGWYTAQSLLVLKVFGRI